MGWAQFNLVWASFVDYSLDKEHNLSVLFSLLDESDILSLHYAW